MNEGDYIQVIFSSGTLDIQSRVTSVESADRLIAVLEICKTYLTNPPEPKP